jgi:hypothetical protein
MPFTYKKLHRKKFHFLSHKRIDILIIASILMMFGIFLIMSGNQYNSTSLQASLRDKLKEKSTVIGQNLQKEAAGYANTAVKNVSGNIGQSIQGGVSGMFGDGFIGTIVGDKVGEIAGNKVRKTIQEKAGKFTSGIGGVVDASQSVGNIIGLGKQGVDLLKNGLPKTCNSLDDIKKGCPPPTPFCKSGNCRIADNTKLLADSIDTKIIKQGTIADAIVFWTNFALIFLFIGSVAAIVYGGYLMIFDLGQGGVEKGKKIIIGVVIGILVIFFAYGIVNTVIKATASLPG